VFGFSFAFFISGFPLVLERRLTWHGRPFGPEQTGYMWAYAGLLGIFLQGPGLGRLVKRFGERTLNRAGFLAYAVGYAMLGFCHSLPILFATVTILAIGGLVRPTLTSLITHAAPREEQGMILGLTQSLMSVSQITAPPLGGFLIEHNLLTAWGLTASAIALTGLAMASRAAQAPAFQAAQIDT
jgi:MFS family permease